MDYKKNRLKIKNKKNDLPESRILSSSSDKVLSDDNVEA